MKWSASSGTKPRSSWILALLVVLAACSGGSSTPSPGLVELNATNRDSVAHAAAASLLALGTSTSVPMLGGADGVAWGRAPLAFGTALRIASGSPRERAQALIPTPPQACLVSGTATVTLDDQNNNGFWDLGEPATVVFDHCQDNAFEMLHGTAVLTVTGASASTFSATMTMTQLSQLAVNGRHSMTLNGALTLDCSLLSASAMRCISAASAPVQAQVHTHQFDDSLSLHVGFSEDSTYDTATGHTLTTLGGTLDSAAAGGAVALGTELAIDRLAADQYPYAGAVRISGSRGTMLITALSATQVRVDLDADGDGTAESTLVETWDWLL